MSDLDLVADRLITLINKEKRFNVSRFNAGSVFGNYISVTIANEHVKWSKVKLFLYSERIEIIVYHHRYAPTCLNYEYADPAFDPEVISSKVLEYMAPAN